MIGYNIVHYPKENEYAIKKYKEVKIWDETVTEEWWLCRNNNEWIWTPKEHWAKRFFHQDTAASALVIAKRKWVKEQEVYRPEPEKQSWSEL